MIEEALKSDSFGDEELIKYMLKAVRDREYDFAGLKEACYANSFKFRQCFRGLIPLLISAGIIKVIDGIFIANIDVDNFVENDFGLKLVDKLFLTLSKHRLVGEFINSRTIVIAQDSQEIRLRSSQIPLKYSSLRNLLITLGIVARDSLSKTMLVVHADYQGWFGDKMSEWIFANEVSNGLRLDKLLANMKRNQESGRRAEEFVIEFERRRLVGHPKLNFVQIISEENAKAGYDILSFANIDSIFIDRFIEVKSYAGEPVFYWTQNELEIAKLKADAYFIYLVDSQKIGIEGYSPKFIQDPANVLFPSQDWDRECQSFRFFHANRSVS